MFDSTRSSNTQLFHITHIDNLPNILASHGLWCDKIRIKENIQSTNIAYNSLKEQRINKEVPCYTGKTLGDFVPFYFSNRSPMLFSISKGFVEGYKEGQNPIIYLVTTIERIITKNIRWCFTDGHARPDITNYFTDLDDLANIDWDVINSMSWGNSEEDPDRRRRKQAEFLVEQFVPWDIITKIGVFDLNYKVKVDTILREEPYKPDVSIEKIWYY